MTNSETEKPKPSMSLEARMSFIDRAQANAVWMNANAIAEAIGIYDRWVYRTVNDLGIQSELKASDGIEIAMYPPWTVDVLREELQWREYLQGLPDQLSIDEIADSLGRSRGWVQKNFEEHELYPIRKRGPAKYGKRALKELRHISMAVPLDDGWYNLGQLVELTGQDREWIERRLLEAGYDSMERRSALTGKIHEYFPPGSLDVVTAAMAERATAAGDWMTVFGMAKQLGRNEKWISSRVTEYQDLSEFRQDDMGVTRIHYPPVVLEALTAKSETARQLPERGDFLSIHDVARLSGYANAPEQTRQRLEKLGIEPELRQDKKGRAWLCYPPSVAQQLIDSKMESKTVSAGDISDAQLAVGSLRSQIKLKQAVDKELKQYGISSHDGQRQAIKADIDAIRRELKLAMQRLYRLENKF